MTEQSRAAQIWAALERRLIEQCGLPAGRMLDVNRPYLIRWIGERLKATPVDTAVPARDLRLDDSAPALTFKSTKNVGHKSVAVGQNSARTHTFHDQKLAAMLERSCSLRGYDGDEQVG